MHHQNTGKKLEGTQSQQDINKIEPDGKRQKSHLLVNEIQSKVNMARSKLDTFKDLDQPSKDFINHLLTDIQTQTSADQRIAQEEFYHPFRKDPKDQDNAFARLSHLLLESKGIEDSLQKQDFRAITKCFHQKIQV